MPQNVFSEKHEAPAEARIREKLKSTYPVLQKVREAVSECVDETLEEWKYYGIKNGWVMKTLLKKRNLFFISIYEGCFKISFVFGEKAVSEIITSDISENLIEELNNARKYAEGRGLSITVKDNSYLQDIRKLIKFKVET